MALWTVNPFFPQVYITLKIFPSVHTSDLNCMSKKDNLVTLLEAVLLMVFMCSLKVFFRAFFCKVIFITQDLLTGFLQLTFIHTDTTHFKIRVILQKLALPTRILAIETPRKSIYLNVTKSPIFMFVYELISCEFIKKYPNFSNILHCTR